MQANFAAVKCINSKLSKKCMWKQLRLKQENVKKFCQHLTKDQGYTLFPMCVSVF